MIKILPIKKGKITLKPIEEESNITINQATTVINENYTEEEVNEIVEQATRGYINVIEHKISGTYVIPETITELGYMSYCGQQNVVNYICHNGITSLGSANTFRWNTSLKGINLPQNENITAIPPYCFANCTALERLENITIPSNITSIGDYAFNTDTALLNATIPSTVKTIGANCFQSDSKLTTVDFEGVTSLGNLCFDNCTKLVNVNLPNVTSIGESCFYRTSALRVLELPKLTTVKNYSFRSCGIYQFIFPNTVTNLNYTGVFYEAKSLKLADIPSGVTTIGGNFFYNCTALQTVIVRRPTPPSLNASAFRGVKTNGKIYVPYGCSAAYLASAAWATSTGNYYPKKYGWTIHELDEDGNIPTE